MLGRYGDAGSVWMSVPYCLNGAATGSEGANLLPSAVSSMQGIGSAAQLGVGEICGRGGRGSVEAGRSSGARGGGHK